MGSSTGIRIKVTFYRTELAMHIHIDRYKNMISYDVGDFVMDPWYTVHWRLPAYVRMDETVLTKKSSLLGNLFPSTFLSHHPPPRPQNQRAVRFPIILSLLLAIITLLR
jgi:3',5'-cyclic AMP phosphodiesterase CpdA